MPDVKNRGGWRDLRRHLRCAATAVLLTHSTLLVSAGIAAPASERSISVNDRAPIKAAPLDEAAASAADEANNTPMPTVGPGDLLDVRLTDDGSLSSSLSGSFRIAEDGSITLPVFGRQDVAGQTTAQVGALIGHLIAGEAAVGVRPFVRIAEYAPVHVMGDVAASGSRPFRPGLDVSELVLLAGGLRFDSDVEEQLASLHADLDQMGLERTALLSAQLRYAAQLSGEDVASRVLATAGSGPMQSVGENDLQLLEASQRARRSQMENFEAQRQTYDQEIAALEQSLNLHEQNYALLKEQVGTQEDLAERGLMPQSRFLEAQRELLAVERQGLEYQTRLFQARQNRLGVEQEINDAEIAAASEAHEQLRSVNHALALIDDRIGSARKAAARLEARRNLGPAEIAEAAEFEVLRRDGEHWSILAAAPQTVLERGDFLRVRLNREALRNDSDGIASASNP